MAMTPKDRQEPALYDFLLPSPWEADEPSLRKELNIQRALGRILNKRAWWAAWTASSPDVRAQWVQEIEEYLVRLHVGQMQSILRNGSRIFWRDFTVHIQHLAAIPVGSTKRQQETDVIVNEIVYRIQNAGDFGNRDLEEEEEDGDEDDASDDFRCRSALESGGSSDDDMSVEGEDDSEDELMLGDDDDCVVRIGADQWMELIGGKQGPIVTEEEIESAAQQSGDKPKHVADPFGQIVWFLNLLPLRERLLVLTPEEVTKESTAQLFELAEQCRDEASVARAVTFILEGLRHGVHCPVVDILWDDVRCVLLGHIQAIGAQLEEAKLDISTTLDIVIQYLELGSTAELACTPGPVALTWMRDTNACLELTATVTSEIARLRHSVATRPGVMVHLVDPSLCCRVGGVTKHFSDDQLAMLRYKSPAQQVQTMLETRAASTTKSPRPFDTDFPRHLCLPCEIQIDEQSGSAKIFTYINNLHPDKFANLYSAIEQIFSRFVPLLENVFSFLDKDADIRTLQRLYKYGGHSLPRAPRLVPRGLFDSGRQQLPWLRGHQVQVIVRVTEIQLNAEHPEFAGEDWHSEGVEADRIAAVGVYFFAVENVTQPRIAFRTFVKPPFHTPEDNCTLGLLFGLHDRDLLMQDLGHVDAEPGRCIAFPNRHQSKIEPFRLVDPSRPGTVGMVTFLQPRTHTGIWYLFGLLDGWCASAAIVLDSARSCTSPSPTWSPNACDIADSDVLAIGRHECDRGRAVSSPTCEGTSPRSQGG